MKKIIILKGLPASGKSTWARAFVDENKGSFKRVNKDDLRSMLDNGNWSKANERLILEIRNDVILAALNDGKSVIVDDTNLHPKHESDIRLLAKTYHPDAEIEIKTFDTGVEECIARDLKRPNSVGEKVIRGMYRSFVKQEGNGYVPKAGTPTAVICDLDGTLARMSGRGPFDWDRVGEDSVNEPVRFAIQSLSDLGVKIILVSGRDAVCRDVTVNWLEGNLIPWDELHMRDEGNNEKDSVIKRRIFDERLRDRFNIRFVLDDRNQVVEMWRDLGLTCFQVDEGNF